MLLVTVPMAESLYKDTRTAFGIVLFGEPQYFAIGKIYFTCIPRLGRPGIMLGWPDDTVILDGDIMTFDDDITWTLGGNIILDGSICKLDWFINIIGTPITDCRIHGQFGQQIPVEHHLTDSAPTITAQWTPCWLHIRSLISILYLIDWLWLHNKFFDIFWPNFQRLNFRLIRAD